MRKVLSILTAVVAGVLICFILYKVMFTAKPNEGDNAVDNQVDITPTTVPTIIIEDEEDTLYKPDNSWYFNVGGNNKNGTGGYITDNEEDKPVPIVSFGPFTIWSMKDIACYVNPYYDNTLIYEYVDGDGYVIPVTFRVYENGDGSRYKSTIDEYLIEDDKDVSDGDVDESEEVKEKEDILPPTQFNNINENSEFTGWTSFEIDMPMYGALTSWSTNNYNSYQGYYFVDDTYLISIATYGEIGMQEVKDVCKRILRESFEYNANY